MMSHYADTAVIVKDKGCPQDILCSIILISQGDIENITPHVGKDCFPLLDFSKSNGCPSLGVIDCQIDIAPMPHVHGQSNIRALLIMTGYVLHEDVTEETGDILLTSVQFPQLKVLGIGTTVYLGHPFVRLMQVTWLGTHPSKGYLSAFVGKNHIPRMAIVTISPVRSEIHGNRNTLTAQ